MQAATEMDLEKDFQAGTALERGRSQAQRKMAAKLASKKGRTGMQKLQDKNFEQACRFLPLTFTNIDKFRSISSNSQCMLVNPMRQQTCQWGHIQDAHACMLLWTEAGEDNHNLHVAGAGIPVGAATEAWQGALHAIGLMHCDYTAREREKSMVSCEYRNLQMLLNSGQKNMPFDALLCLSLQDATSGLFRVSPVDLSEKVTEFRGDSDVQRLVSSSTCHLSQS